MISKTVQPYLFRFSGFGLGIDFTDVFYNYVVVVDLKIFYAENFLLFASLCCKLDIKSFIEWICTIKLHPSVCYNFLI